MRKLYIGAVFVIVFVIVFIGAFWVAGFPPIGVDEVDVEYGPDIPSVLVETIEREKLSILAAVKSRRSKKEDWRSFFKREEFRIEVKRVGEVEVWAICDGFIFVFLELEGRWELHESSLP